MRPAFDDADDGHGVEKGGKVNGSWREGELVDVRQRSSKRQHDRYGARQCGSKPLKT
jgi:hypothetical protein